MRLKKDNSEQKLRGAYYTPLQLANAMVNLCVSEDIHTVLEPSCGDGVFLDSLSRLNLIEKIGTIDAVEIEQEEAEKVQNNYCNYHNVHILHEDFFEFYSRMISAHRQYDLILGNPPYIRYQYLTETQRELQSNILTSHGMKANKLINAWVAFLVACVQLLSENGRIAFVIPAEILQVAYAEELRLFLSEHLAKITLITFEQLIFPDIEQEVVVLIGEKGSTEKGIRIFEVNNLSDFETLDLHQNEFQKMQHVKEKWTRYFTTAKEMELIQTIRNDKRFAKFADYGTINVGITTGNNRYFSISEELCDEYDLENVTLPLIGRSSHAHGIFFTDEDWEKNKASGKNARLVSFPDIPIADYPERHKAYITLGEANGENKGYKCSIRNRWYIVPSVWVPDAFFLRRNNLYPKFVLNSCNAVSTDTMHRMRFNPNVKPENILLAYYNSISFAFTEICGRSYGGGVLEILPGEMGNIMLPKLDDIDEETCQSLLNRIDIIVREGNDIERALDIVDKEILIDGLGIDAEWCEKCRIIWKKLQRRRLGRG
ncbi:N-6 DNA methylase [Alloscardovia omnicolens]|uniref:N-6 DNA methylase n=1 Tax=Alloscardovia omnicolens TaxID=419015 RepID=UPI003A611093